MALPVTTNLVLHLDANTLSCNSNGTAISLWADGSTSNNDAHQPTGAAQSLIFNSIINGQSALQFDGTNDYMTAVGVSADFQNTPFEIFIVALDNEGVAFTPLVSWNEFASTDNSSAIDLRDSDNSSATQFDLRKFNGNAQSLTKAGDVGGNFALVNAHYDGLGDNDGTDGTLRLAVNSGDASTLSCDRSIGKVTVFAI